MAKSTQISGLFSLLAASVLAGAPACAATDELPESGDTFAVATDVAVQSSSRSVLVCRGVTVDVDATAARPGAPFVGTAVHTFDDGRVATAQLTVAFNAPPQPVGEASIIDATNTYVFPDGTITGLNLSARLPRQADGASDVIGNIQYTAGTGTYRKVAGQLRFFGSVSDAGDVFDGHIQGVADGLLCRRFRR